MINAERGGFCVRPYASMDEIPEHVLSAWSDRSAHSLFSTPAWYRNFYQNVGRALGELLLLTVEDDGRNCVALLPLLSCRRMGGSWCRITTLGNYYSPSFEVLVDESRISRDAAIELFVEQLVSMRWGWDVIDLFPLRRDGGDQDRLQNAFHRHRRRADQYFQTANWQTPVTGFAAYLGARPSRLRNTYRRRSKKLQDRFKTELRVFSMGAEVDGGLRDYEYVYERSWKINEPYPDFIRELAALASASGWLRLGVLYLDDSPAAAQMWFVRGRTAYIYKLAYVPEYSVYSVGIVLTAKLAEYVIEVDHVATLDFLTGDDDYKKEWMTERHELWGLRVTNPMRPAGLALTLKDRAGEAKRALRGGGGGATGPVTFLSRFW